MKYFKRAACLAALTVLMLLLSGMCAWGETARVVTPGGPVNVRRKPDTKAGLAGTVPNRETVEAEEVQGAWTLIRYGKVTGYVKTEFLRLISDLPGKTVYADRGTLLIREGPDQDARILLPADAQQAVTVLELAGEWAHISCGEVTGYVPAAELSLQLDAPSGQRQWLLEAGVLTEQAELLSALGTGTVFAVLGAGTRITVAGTEGDRCLAVTESGCGWLPVSSVALTGPEDSAEALPGLTPLQAGRYAEEALKKAFRDFAKTPTWCAVEIYEGSAYHCGFIGEDGRCLYGALADTGGNVLFTADYTAFAVPAAEGLLLEPGQVDLQVSDTAPAVGGVVDISVLAWPGCTCAYTLTRDGKTVSKSPAGDHFAAAWRPREEGEYVLQVTVGDGSGRTASARQAVTVQGQAAPEEGVYSQKDGWWLDKAYRDSTLDKSGCAVFTLSHALRRMGQTGPESRPEALAKAYALCLRPEGTNNERLIREAGQDFGYSTRSQLITDEKKIASLLRDGAMFSFSIARGHIALIRGVSEDGTMVQVTDSAPGATFERIVDENLYLRSNSGSFRAALKLQDIPGARWYFETGEYGGLEYWLPVSYAARRGVRLIQP